MPNDANQPLDANLQQTLTQARAGRALALRWLALADTDTLRSPAANDAVLAVLMALNVSGDTLEGAAKAALPPAQAELTAQALARVGEVQNWPLATLMQTHYLAQVCQLSAHVT